MQVSDNMRWKSGYQENSESQRLPQIRIIINGPPELPSKSHECCKDQNRKNSGGNSDEYSQQYFKYQ